jgi:hypothetical protein
MNNSAQQLPEFAHTLPKQVRPAFWIAQSATLLALGLLASDLYELYTSLAASDYLFSS